MNSIVDVISAAAAQANPDERRAETYRVFASNLKCATRPGLVLGSVDFFLPDLGLHLHCAWLRDERGNEHLGMPRCRVETPSGGRHYKTLARWHTAAAAARFQRAGLAALHQLVAKTEPVFAKDRDQLPTSTRFAPLTRANTTLVVSASSDHR
jgi:hypothetical protein